MFHSRRTVLGGIAALGLAACGRDLSHLPQAHAVVVQKSHRKMFLIRNRVAHSVYNIELGFAPKGTKTREGDGKTPEGTYLIDRKNPNSSFHLSLGINYPTPQQVAFARASGVSPGGDIFIHGQPNGKYDPSDPDWTAGCIAVENREIEEIYWMVQVGTPVTILA